MFFLMIWIIIQFKLYKDITLIIVIMICCDGMSKDDLIALIIAIMFLLFFLAKLQKVLI